MATMTSSEYLTHVLAETHTNPFILNMDRAFHKIFIELIKLELKRRGLPSEEFDYNGLKPALERVHNREDCADFAIPAMIRMLKEYREMLPADAVKEIETELVNFRYWLSEPGEINACYFTENHQPLYHTAEVLVGAMFPDTIFPSDGNTGAWHSEHGKAMLRRWIDWRARFGFSEWTCNYYEEDIIALLGIDCYCDDEELKKGARLLINTIMFDTAVNTFEGSWIGSRGRTYPRYLVDPMFEGISQVCRLYFGKGSLEGGLSDVAVLMAVYDYQVPEAIIKAANDPSPVIISKERMSLNSQDARLYGIDPDDFDNIMFFWALQTYCYEEVIENSKKVINPHSWMNERINAYSEHYKLCRAAGLPYDNDPDFTAMTQTDIYVYKTPDYAVSCSQDFRRGKQGYQQHPWGAHLGGRAIVYTNHPGSLEYMDRPNAIAGNWYLPRCVQHENVVLSVYRVPAECIRMLETHAYFPQKEFDEVAEKNGWVFGRKNNAYIALKSMNYTEWKPSDPELYRSIYGAEWEKYYSDKPFFYHANGHANVWVTELGSKAQNGSFEQFMAGFGSAELSGDTFDFTYRSPSQGEMRFGWDIPFTVKGEEIQIKDYPRYDNPYCQAAFDSKRLEISCGGSECVIDHNA